MAKNDPEELLSYNISQFMNKTPKTTYRTQ